MAGVAAGVAAGVGPKLLVLVTGASAGFGAAIVARFLADGHRVVAAARRLDRLAALQTEAASDRLHIAALDVRDRAGTEGFLASLPLAFRDVDVLVNNAGLALGLEPAGA